MNLIRMESIKYLTLFVVLVSVIAGNDVITFNQDETSMEDNIDHLLEHEQFIKVGDSKKPTKPVPSAQQRNESKSNSKNAEQLNVRKPALTLSSNCTKPHNHLISKYNATKQRESNVKLEFDDMDMIFEEDVLTSDFSDESVLSRSKRRVAYPQEYGSGVAPMAFTELKFQGTLTSSQASHDSTDNKALRSAIEKAVLMELQTRLPGKKISVDAVKLTPGSIIATIECVYDFSTTDLANTLMEMKKQGNLNINGTNFSILDITLKAESETTLVALFCYTCSKSQTCQEVSPNQWSCILNSNSTIFYPYGKTQGDDTLQKDSEFATKRIEFPNYLPWDNELVRYIWISVNGLISIGEEYASYNPDKNINRYKKVIYPYWADLDSVSSDRGQVFYQVYTSSRGDDKTKRILYKASGDVVKYSNQYDFFPTTVVVATWNDVAPWPASSSSTERVTFQCIIITDGVTSYTMFMYGQGLMKFEPSVRRAVEIGWGRVNLGSRMSYYRFDNIVGNTASNITGAWFFKIGEKENSRAKCVKWFSDEMQSFSWLMWWNSVLPRCPCSEFSALYSGLWIPSFEQSQCYDMVPIFGSIGRRCCYRGFSIDTRIPIAGSLQVSTPYHGDYFTHEKLDNQPKRWCCDQSELCNLYYTLRPQAACTPFFVSIASFFGDPHITTLDNNNYIFNGLGEFWLIKINEIINNATVNFSLQGRTCRAVNNNGTLSNATIWCGLALRTTSNNTVQIEISDGGTYMIIYANGQDYSIRFRDNRNFTANEQGLYLRRLDDSLKISTSDSIGLQVSLSSNMLDFTLEVDNKFKKSPRGLLGNYNDDPSDEFIFPNGTKLSNSSTEREIYEYGLTWAVTSEADALFVHGYNKTFASYTDPNFMPIFLDETNATVREEAAQVCQGPENIACIFDFIATRNEAIAKNTMAVSNTLKLQVQTISNRAPVINGNTNFTVTVNQTIQMEFTGSDEDNDSFIFQLINPPPQDVFSFTFSNGHLSANFTPRNLLETSINIVAVDSKNLSSQVTKLTITLCSGCNNHGTCNSSNILSVLSPYFTILDCDCNTGYTGDHCETDKDGCANNPCPSQTNCTDAPAEEEARSGISYNCSSCPTGFQFDANGTKCEDINECRNGSNPCDPNANCINTFGGFTCTCKSGFRKSGNKCVDINECVENLHGCPHICVNEVPDYRCLCQDGYHSENMGYKCTKYNDTDPCANITSQPCEYGCTNSSGTPKCFCRVGMKLSNNGYSCEDINECDEKLCAQGCDNTIGSYFCSCYPGYYVNDNDKRDCLTCPDNRYGHNCSETCQCRGRATSCDIIRGCVCQTGWSGTNCENDVNECEQDLDNCRPDQICTNTIGSFTCTCPKGFADTNGNCTNINECTDITIHNCSQLCVDNPGSYSCMCRDGFNKNNNTCEDIDECELDIDSCSQNCRNVPGSYNCECFPGFTLSNDRKSCLSEFDVCQNAHLNCSYGCTVKNGTTQCFCQRGFKLSNIDGITCIDINECETGEHKCSELCVNTPGSYNCSCAIGKILQNDERSCEVCDDFHWGDNCVNTCSCNPLGTSRCDPVVGCICKSGWGGSQCYQDINECDYSVSPCPTFALCNNTIGSYRCYCATGFELANNTCVNINECVTSRPCDQDCTDTIGSYQCSCSSGFRSVGDKCIDIDECAVPSLNNCDQKCRNMEGGFACECNEGYILNVTTRNTCYLENANRTCNASGNSCTQVCNFEGGKEVCSCNPGFTLSATDNATCNDINECLSNPCVNGNCSNIDGNFNCSCSDGFKLAADMLTCAACDYGFYGKDCAFTCSCNTTNFVSCDKSNGACSCLPGWTGTNCGIDIDECVSANCPSNSKCTNSPGSYRCVCDVGYYSTGSSCVACDVAQYGQDCAQLCKCNMRNTQDCNDVNGTCTCKPGWTGDTCDTDINECNDANYCTGPTTCVNLNGSAECRCNPGYTKSANGSVCEDINECLDPTLNKCTLTQDCSNTNGSFICSCKIGYSEINGTCQACNSTTYGSNCSDTCKCVATNTADCNDVTGACTCLKGWNGTLCELDINECANTSFCPYPHESCQNLNGSAQCVCDAGYWSPNDTTLCEVCQCDVNNTKDCNETTGFCTCKPGWNGIFCQTDIDECLNSSYCPDPHDSCYNLNGTAQCRCNDGFVFSALNSSCQACDTTHYGTNCSTQCQCVIANTADCNDTNGACTCKQGWNGTFCQTDIDECLNTSYCSDPHGSCYNLNGSAQCRCNDGFVFSALNSSCQACDSTHYGTNCTNVCQCVETNTADCNDTNGNCICKSGWSGTKCDTDINECLNISYCQDPHDSCYNLNGSAECRCDDGFVFSALNSSCQACDETHYGNNCSNTCTCNTTNTLDCNDITGACLCQDGWSGNNCNTALFKAYVVRVTIGYTVIDPSLLDVTSAKYQKLKKEIEDQLNDIGKSNGQGKFIRTIVIGMRNGSLIVDTIVQINNTVDDPDKYISPVVIGYAQSSGYEIDNKTYPAKLVSTPTNNYTNASSVCDVYMHLSEDCKGVCTFNDSNIPQCQALTAVTAETNHDLTIGLAVGIPLFVILAVTVAVIVWCCIKRKSANQTQGSTPSLDRDAPFRSIFATQIATKGSWGTPSLYSPDAYSEAGTSEGSRDGKLIRGKRSGFKDSAWFDGQGTSASRDTMKERNEPKKEGQTSNFSWEYMFKLLEPHKDFEIVRPNYSPSPNPAFIPKNKRGDSNA